MDGVLYDSMKGHVYSYQESLRTYGIDISEDTVYECEGKKGPDTIKMVAEEQLGREVSMEEAEEMYEAKCRIFRSLPLAEKIPGVEALMRRMKGRGIQICVVTGSGQQSLLDRLVNDFPGLIDRDHIVCAKDYKNGKPNPDPYLIGLERCGVKAQDAVVIENAPLGVRAGRAAGIYTIAVNTGPLPYHVFEEAGANQICSSMDDVRLPFGNPKGNGGLKGGTTARVDKWLWAARIFKTRSMAANECKNGRVTKDGVNIKPSFTLKVGDVISVKKPPVTYSFKVLKCIENRVGPKLVPEVYTNVTDPKQYELLEMARISGFVDRARGTGRPTKKDRRAIDAFVDPVMFGFDDDDFEEDDE